MSVEDPYPPLMSPRSPSYERARRELLHPSPSGDPAVVALLAQLSEAEDNAGQVCARVLAKLSEGPLATRVQADAATHQARRAALGELITALGGSPPRSDECRKILDRGIEAAARADSQPTAIAALKIMRDQLSAAYDEAIRSPLLDAAQRASLGQLAP
jgi:hypothetical protein